MEIVAILVSISSIFPSNLNLFLILHASPVSNSTELEVLGDFDKAVSRIPIIDLLRGRDGLPGRDGKDGEQGPRGERGMQGAQGPPGPRSAGVTYTRWGSGSCPSTPGTELVYSGIAGGTFYNIQGGAEKFYMPITRLRTSVEQLVPVS